MQRYLGWKSTNSHSDLGEIYFHFQFQMCRIFTWYLHFSFFFQSVLLFLSRNLIVFVELNSFYHEKFLYWKGSESFSVTCCFCRNFNNAQHIFDDHNSKFTINWKLLRPRKTVPSPEYLWDEYLIYSSEYLILTNQYAVVIRVGNITPWFFREIKTWFITSIGTIFRCK